MTRGIKEEFNFKDLTNILNESNADFGVYREDIVAFEWSKRDDNQMIGVALLPWMGI